MNTIHLVINHHHSQFHLGTTVRVCPRPLSTPLSVDDPDALIEFASEEKFIASDLHLPSSGTSSRSHLSSP
jgi:hypothetical protein